MKSFADSILGTLLLFTLVVIAAIAMASGNTTEAVGLMLCLGALEFHGADYHFLQEGDVEAGALAAVKSATLSGTRETEAWGKDGNGEFNALAIGGLKQSGERVGYASALDEPPTTGTMEIAGVTLARKGYTINASIEDFTEISEQGIGAPGLGLGA